MIGLGMGLGLSRPSGSTPFTPASLSPTAWYDPSDLATVWQDSARTTPASVNGVVGALDDKSGNGNHLLQATTAKKPTLRQSGVMYYLEFDGVDDEINDAFALVQPVERISALRQVVWFNGGRIYDGSGVNSGILLMNGATPTIALHAGLTAADNAGLAVGVNGVATERFNGASSRLAINNGAYTTGNAGASNPAGVVVGAAGGGANLNSNIWFFGMVIKAGSLTDAQIGDTRTYLANKAGVTL